MATLKQEAAVKVIVENHGNISKAMKEVGYTDATAKNPSNLTNSLGFKELMQKYLPDDKVLRTHDEALTANKVISAKIIGANANENTDDFIEVPDHPTRLKAVELAYKVGGKLKDDTPQQFNAEEMKIVFFK